MPRSDAYSPKEDVQLGNGQTKDFAAQTVEAIQIEVTQGSVQFKGKAGGGITPTGCANRCLKQLASDTVIANELSGFALSHGQDGSAIRAKGRSEHQPVRVSAELSTGEYIQYSGALDVTLTGTSSDTALILVSSSATLLDDNAP